MPILGIAASGNSGGGGDFDPLSIPWVHAYSADGPEFVALGLSNGASVTNMPDEAGSDDLTNNSNVTYTAADSGLNNKPTVVISNTNFANRLQKLTLGTAVTAPFSVAMVARWSSIGASWFFDGGNSNSTRNQLGFSNTPQYRIFSDGTTFEQSVDGGTPSTTAPHLMIAEFASAAHKVIVDGTQVISGNAGTLISNCVGITIGNDYSLNTHDATLKVPFVGVIDRALTTQEKTDLLSWSQGRFGTP